MTGQVRLCGALHMDTGAVCELPLDHAENHRGSFSRGIAQWPYFDAHDQSPAPVSPVAPTPEPPNDVKQASIATLHSLHAPKELVDLVERSFNQRDTAEEMEPPREIFYLPPSVTRRRAEKAEAMVEQLEGNIARQAGFMLAQDEKVVALQAEIERLSAKYNDAHLRALKAEAGAPAPCVWRDAPGGAHVYAACALNDPYPFLKEEARQFSVCPYCAKSIRFGHPLTVER